METLYGYAGKLLFIDLSTGEIKKDVLDKSLATDFLGGYGIGAKILFDNMKPGTAPFSEESILGFTTGPATATGTVMGGRFNVVSKSPVTGMWNDSNSGGYFGPELKKAGYDAVFIKGKSDKPVYIWIYEGEVEIRDASSLWGKSVKETEALLKEITGEPKLQAASIGVAGENLSYTATIMTDSHRAAGRAGSGSVMGWKNLKAIACKGTKRIEVADPLNFKDLNIKITKILADPPPEMKASGRIKNFSKWGTSQGNKSNAISGDTPVKNWGGAGLIDYGVENIENIDLPNFDQDYNTGRYGCSNCAIRCGAHYDVKEGKYFTGKTDRPEYETWAAFGPNCLNGNRDSIIACNEMCNEAGMDTIAAGSTIAWVMECFENKILSEDELDGLTVKWGDPDIIVTLLNKMINAEGVGKKLMNGQKFAMEAFGKGFEFDATAGGVEPGMHDGRFALGYNRIYQFDPTPGRHMKGGAAYMPLDLKNRPAIDAEEMTAREILNCAGFCAFGRFGFEKNTINDFLTYITGTKYDEDMQDKVGKRIFFLRHLFNYREGMRRRDMKIAPRLNGPLSEGPNKGVVIDSEKLGDDFFNEIGIDPDSLIPRREVLDKIGGLEFLYEILYGEK